MQNLDPRNTHPIVTTPSPFAALDASVVYSSTETTKVDVQMAANAQQFRAEEFIDWDDEFNQENDYE